MVRGPVDEGVPIFVTEPASSPDILPSPSRRRLSGGDPINLGPEGLGPRRGRGRVGEGVVGVLEGEGGGGGGRGLREK